MIETEEQRTAEFKSAVEEQEKVFNKDKQQFKQKVATEVSLQTQKKQAELENQQTVYISNNEIRTTTTRSGTRKGRYSRNKTSVTTKVRNKRCRRHRDQHCLWLMN